MVFCGQCGTQFDDGVNFCPGCGAAAPKTVQAAPARPTVAQPAAAAVTTDAQANKTMGILAYIGPLVLVPIFAARESNFARFHANQGLILFILMIVLNVIHSILFDILNYGFLWRLNNWLYFLCGTVIFVLAIIGIINVCNGKKQELPLIGGFRILK